MPAFQICRGKTPTFSKIKTRVQRRMDSCLFIWQYAPFRMTKEALPNKIAKYRFISNYPCTQRKENATRIFIFLDATFLVWTRVHPFLAFFLQNHCCLMHQISDVMATARKGDGDANGDSDILDASICWRSADKITHARKHTKKKQTHEERMQNVSIRERAGAKENVSFVSIFLSKTGYKHKFGKRKNSQNAMAKPLSGLRKAFKENTGTQTNKQTNKQKKTNKSKLSRNPKMTL